MTAHDIVVDVGMPTLGTSPYLAEAIASVFAQTLTSWRLVISENGTGNEELRAKLADYVRDERVLHRVVGQSITLPANWTRALQSGSARYVTLLHDDDRWHPDFLSTRVAFLEANPRCGFVFGGYRIIDEVGAVIGTVERDLPHGVSMSSYVLPILYENCIVAPPTALVRRAAYEAVGAEFREVFLSDYEMWIRLATQCDVGYLSICDSDYRFHPTQTTTTHRVRIGKGQLEVLDATEHLTGIPNHVRRRTRARAHLLCAIDNVELGNRREALIHLWSAIRTEPALLVAPKSSARILLALIAVAFGERGQRAISSLRLQRYLNRTGGNTAE